MSKTVPVPVAAGVTPPIGLAGLCVADERDVFRSRHLTREIARLLHLDLHQQIRLATVVSELCRELVSADIPHQLTFELNAGPAAALVVTAHRSGPRSEAAVLRTITEELPSSPDVTPHDLAERIHEALRNTEPVSTLDALGSHNRDLLDTLDELRAQQNELERAGRELEETNRGVVALYAELDAAASALQDTAHILQRAMLSEPPTVEGVDICVRYRPAEARDGAEAGGDWYDVFGLPDGDLALVVGDVVGHDTKAAATMGQLRAMLHGLAFHNSGPPHHTLESLDRTVRSMRLTPFTTGIYARLHISQAEDTTSGLVMSWSNAGHPGMIVVRPDGTGAYMDKPRDTALGVLDGHSRTAGRRFLPPGTLILMFSDGLFERRDEDLDVSMAALLERTTLNSRLPLDELCDFLVETAPDEDDLVLVAFRLAS